MAKSYLALVLHNHLPYVISHGKWPHGLDWLNEAASETYIPVLDALYDLEAEGISPKITVGLTPVLCEQLKDRRFKQNFEEYLKQKIESAQTDRDEFQRYGDGHKAYLAQFWIDFYERVGDHFENRYNTDITSAFRKLQDDGHIEIITSAATHGYLPLLGRDSSVRAQIRGGVTTYERHFGRRPRGIWLPECAYRPRYEWASPLEEGGGQKTLRAGVEEFLFDEGIEYFIIDSHLLRGGKAVGVYIDRFEGLKRLWEQFARSYQPKEEDREKTPYAYYLASSPGGNKPVAIFARDPKTALQVWSGESGYPGDGDYLDFHKKHFPGGHRYWRVTDTNADLGDKQEYEPARIDEILENQTDHFVELAKGILSDYNEDEGIIVAPYDGELFGHWWFEGPRWIYRVLKKLHNDSQIDLATCGEYLESHSPKAVVHIPEGSWGEGGFHYIWLNDWTKWTWKYIYEAEERFEELAGKFEGTENRQLKEILDQAAVELLLLQSSDWQFLISTWHARNYAEARTSLHYENFKRLCDMAEKNKEITDEDKAFLESCKKQDSLFEDVDFTWWTQKKVDSSP